MERGECRRAAENQNDETRQGHGDFRTAEPPSGSSEERRSKPEKRWHYEPGSNPRYRSTN
jgi:hypothetical protein